MKVNKGTGLVPTKFLKPAAGFAKGETGGLRPSDFRKLEKKGVVQFNSDADPESLKEIDDTTGADIVAVPTPSLGGYDHESPNAWRKRDTLSSSALPGRAATFEDPDLGRRGEDSAEARPAATAQEAVDKASGQHDGKLVGDTDADKGTENDGDTAESGRGTSETPQGRSGAKATPPTPPKSAK